MKRRGLLFQLMMIGTDNGPLYYEVTGEGRPLVFISGWAMSCESWRPVVELLNTRYQCLIYDTRGMARSQPAALEASFDLKEHAEDLHAILKAENLFDATFIAHEMGGLIAALCAEAHPQDVGSFIFVSPRASFSQDEIKSLSVFTPASLALREIATFPVVRNLIAFRFRHAPQPYRNRLFDDFAELSPRAAYETALSASEYYADSPVERRIEETQLPSLFVCGDEDKKSVAQTRKLFSLAREGRLATIRECNFLPMLEYPKQFARLIDDFTRRVGIPNRKMISLR
jgi:pimeloyl-ACP methyl ester carboxylesterase